MNLPSSIAYSRKLTIKDRRRTARAPEPKAAPQHPCQRLTVRETEILALLSAGIPVKLMSDQLGISSHTIRHRLQFIYRKLAVSGQVEAAVLWVLWKREPVTIKVPGTPAQAQMS